MFFWLHRVDLKGLEQVVRRLQLQGLPDIGKAFMGSQQNKLSILLLSPEPGKQIQTAFLGHLDIADHQIDRFL